MMTHAAWVQAKNDLATPGDLLPEGWTFIPWREQPFNRIFPYYICGIWAGPVMEEGTVVAYATVEMSDLERNVTRDARLQITRTKIEAAIASARDLIASKAENAAP